MKKTHQNLFNNEENTPEFIQMKKTHQNLFNNEENTPEFIQ